MKLRTEELLEKRGLGKYFQSDTESLISGIWSAWKNTSSSRESKAFQLAAAEELNGYHLFSKDEEQRLKEGLLSCYLSNISERNAAFCLLKNSGARLNICVGHGIAG